MGKTAFAPDQVQALPGATAAAFAWRARGQLQVTVLVKATFAFAPDAAMTVAEPEEVHLAEVYHRGGQGRMVRFASDWAPYLPRAEVVFTGHAHAPPGATSLPVRLTIYDGDRLVLDKALRVQDAAPFGKMPLVYERSPAGADLQENPFGVAPDGPDAPNVVDPRDPARPAGLGPIPRAWPSRRRLLGDLPREALESPVQELPDHFKWSYFQSAPPDQQVERLHGGEWIVMQGLLPGRPQLRTRLPEARGLARVYGLSAFGVAEGQPLELQADHLHLDGDEERCTLSFRRSFPVPSEAALASVRIVAGVELPGAPLAWPVQNAPPARPRIDTGTLALAPETTLQLERLPFGAQTMAVTPAEEDLAKNKPSLPFSPDGAPARIVDPPGPVAIKEHLPTGTLALPGEEEEPAPAPAPLLSESSESSEPPPPEPAPAEPPPEEEPRASVQASIVTEERPAAEPAPAPPVEKPRPVVISMPPAASPALKASLYKRFDRNER